MGTPEDNNKTIPSEVDQFKNSPKRDNAENDKAESSEKNENTVKQDDKQSGCVENKEDGGAKLVEESSDNEEGDADDEKGRNVKLTEKGSDIEEDSDNEDGGGKV